MMGREIERKFLVVGPYKAEAVASQSIRQGYLTSEAGITVRIRIEDGRGILTVKGPACADGLSRSEWEYAIPTAEAEAMLCLCTAEPVAKTRWIVPAGPHCFEVDEFHGANRGLVVAEVELGAPDEPFLRPDWLGPEVTFCPEYANAALARRPFTEWGEE